MKILLNQWQNQAIRADQIVAINITQEPNQYDYTLVAALENGGVLRLCSFDDEKQAKRELQKIVDWIGTLKTDSSYYCNRVWAYTLKGPSKQRE